MNRLLLPIVALALVGARVQAEPAPADPPEKAKARALLKEGVRLLDAGQLIPALRRFEDAYAAFPSAKILVNIGTAQSGLGRSSDAANTYQRYLDSGNEDPVQVPAVTTALAELDAKLGRLMVKVRGSAGATSVRVANGPWIPLSPSGLVRVAPGRFDVQVRATAGSREASASGTVAAREQRDVVVDLAPQESVRESAGTQSDSPAHAAAQESASRAIAIPSESPSREAAPGSAIGPAGPELSPEAPSPAGTADARVSVEPQARASRWTPLRQGAVVAGAVGIVGLTAMSVLAVGARSMWNDARMDMDVNMARQAATRANLATGAGVIGAAALGTGIVLWFVGAPRDRAPQAVTAIIDGTQVGLAVMGPW